MKEGLGRWQKNCFRKKTVLKMNEVINQQKEVKKWMSETFTNKQENSQTDVKKKLGCNEGYFS